MAGQETINSRASNNYIIHSKDCPLNPQINILGDFFRDTMNELLGELHNIVIKLPQKPIYEISKKIISPYDIDDPERPVLDIIINSNGGDGEILKSMYTILDIAKARGAIVRTTVIGAARSCGSLLAISGTPGFRLMGELSSHYIHYGSGRISATSDLEAREKANQMRLEKKHTLSKYEEYTKIPKKNLTKYLQHEIGEIPAEKCLDWCICDWIISKTGLKTR